MSTVGHTMVLGGTAVAEEATIHKRGRGRPRIERTAEDVTRRVRLPPDVYDALCRIAIRERTTVHALLVRAARRVAALDAAHARLQPVASTPA